MRPFTKFEADFIHRIREELRRAPSDYPLESVVLCESPEIGPGLDLDLKLKSQTELINVRVLIYGSRPVRYHIESSAETHGEIFRQFWHKVLGALNLVSERSGIKGDRCHLFYELEFSDQELKRLGEST